MPLPNLRPSLTTNIETRYDTQHAGGAFDVKKTLGSPGTVPLTGNVIDSVSRNGQTFQSPNGFQVKMLLQQSQLIAVQSGDTRGLSTYIRGLDTTRYAP